MFKKTTLENGLRIITAPMQGTNTVTVLVLCGTGSDYESKDISGISHFLEHMFFKGTQKRPIPETIAEELDGKGSVHNAFTDHEVTGYFIKVGKGSLDWALEMLADIYHSSLILEEEVDREKQVIVEEMHKDKDIPTRYIWRVWEHLLYGDQPAGWDIGGEENVIRALGRKDLLGYFHHQYVVSNTVVVVAGNFESEKAIERVRFYFSDGRADKPARSKPSVIEKQGLPEAKVEYKETDQTHLIVGFRGYGTDHQYRYAADILGVILGGGVSSRMFMRIREKLGLAYNVWSAHESYSNRGFLVTYAGVDHKNVEKTMGAILYEYKKIRSEPVNERELQRVKDYIRGTTLIGLEQSDAVAGFIGREEMATGKPMTADEVFAKIEKITVADVSAVAKEIMRPERLNLAMIGPFKEKDNFEKLLKGF